MIVAFIAKFSRKESAGEYVEGSTLIDEQWVGPVTLSSHKEYTLMALNMIDFTGQGWSQWPWHFGSLAIP